MEGIMDDRILLLIQGPVHTDLKGRSTFEVLEAINALPGRERLFVTYAMWRDEPDALKAKVAELVDHLTFANKPAEPGGCNRNYQAASVSAAIADVEHLGFRYALKTRSDMILSAKFLERVLAFAASGSEKLLVTNLFTRIEAFHVSDMILCSTLENVRDYYRAALVNYEDLFSPEVQFTRVFIRTRKLPFAMRQRDYFQFLREWVELVDFDEMGLKWLKSPLTSVRQCNRVNFIVEDRDCGPVLTRLVTPRFHRFLSKTRIPLNLIAAGYLIYDDLYRTVCFTSPFARWITYTINSGGPERYLKTRDAALSTLPREEFTTALVASPMNGAAARQQQTDLVP